MLLRTIFEISSQPDSVRTLTEPMKPAARGTGGESASASGTVRLKIDTPMRFEGRMGIGDGLSGDREDRPEDRTDVVASWASGPPIGRGLAASGVGRPPRY